MFLHKKHHFDVSYPKYSPPVTYLESKRNKFHNYVHNITR